MARQKSEWPAKVLALVKSGNLDAASAQIRVAPTVADVVQLQLLLRTLPASKSLTQLQQFVAEQRALLAAPRLHRSP